MVQMNEEELAEARRRMVESLVHRNVLTKENCIRSMLRVKRHLFVWRGWERYAYRDNPLPLGSTGQTISAPHMCAYMLEALDLEEGDNVLEIGTGSGYHGALVAECVAPSNRGEEAWGRVTTIESERTLYEFAKENLERSGYSGRVTCIHGDGTLGVPPMVEKELYDKILVTAGAPHPPPPLLKQLRKGGIFVIPVGGRFYQTLEKIVKREDGNPETLRLINCVFVPLLGKYGWT